MARQLLAGHLDGWLERWCVGILGGVSPVGRVPWGLWWGTLGCYAGVWGWGESMGVSVGLVVRVEVSKERFLEV